MQNTHFRKLIFFLLEKLLEIKTSIFFYFLTTRSEARNVINSTHWKCKHFSTRTKFSFLKYGYLNLDRKKSVENDFSPRSRHFFFITM